MLMSIAAPCMKEGSSQTKCYSIRTKLVRSFLYAPLVWRSMEDLFLPKRVYSALWSILHCCWTLTVWSKLDFHLENMLICTAIGEYTIQFY